MTDLPRVITRLSHGGHALSDAAASRRDAAQADVARVSDVARVAPALDLADISTPFGYLFPDLSDEFPHAHLRDADPKAVVAGLQALASAMVDSPADDEPTDSAIPPIYTYWGQFVDHDLTANTDRDSSISIVDGDAGPLAPADVRFGLRNLREPQLNLDSLYGNGPAASGGDGEVPYEPDGSFVIGSLAAGPPVSLPGADLPRATVDGVPRAPLVGDTRNDENLVVAQLHLAFLRFHNAVVAAGHDFETAKRLVQWHYQWITVNDFLRRIADGTVVDRLLPGATDPLPPFFRLRDGEPYMPLEFSIAAFRFGHSMVRGTYDWNHNFGEPASPAGATFDLLFRFTGKGGFFGAPTLPDNWPAQFERFTGEAPGVPGFPARFARKIDTRLAPPLTDLTNEGTDPELPLRIRRILRRLAVRNLMRGYRLAMPTGQSVAGLLGVTPLTRAELRGSDQHLQDALVDGGFLGATPLWFYVLREAEVVAGGERLGPVGSRIVAETIVGQVRVDPDSFLSNQWDPSQSLLLEENGSKVPIDSITRFLRFAGMHP
jgi:hypothetical protein